MGCRDDLESPGSVWGVFACVAEAFDLRGRVIKLWRKLWRWEDLVMMSCETSWVVILVGNLGEVLGGDKMSWELSISYAQHSFNLHLKQCHEQRCPLV